jgi:hypothetical protein
MIDYYNFWGTMIAVGFIIVCFGVYQAVLAYSAVDQADNRAYEDKEYNVSQDDQLLSLIALAESSDGKYKTGDNGKSIGKYQIGRMVLSDYNAKHKTKYKLEDLCDDDISEKVARWHLNHIIKHLTAINKYSIAKVCQVWNEGYSALDRPIPKRHKNLIYDGVYLNYWGDMKGEIK